MFLVTIFKALSNEITKFLLPMLFKQLKAAKNILIYNILTINILVFAPNAVLASIT